MAWFRPPGPVSCCPEVKRTPATRDDVRTAPADVWINFPSLLAAGDPSVVPATRIILNPRAKKPR